MFNSCTRDTETSRARQQNDGKGQKQTEADKVNSYEIKPLTPRPVSVWWVKQVKLSTGGSTYIISMPFCEICILHFLHINERICILIE